VNREAPRLRHTLNDVYRPDSIHTDRVWLYDFHETKM